ncbi:hypothetical protein AWV79_32225 [Cupriavidus sp. UYMMa02A]|nr:hypothetical protein AWV79_32225 [Cupriavidus sp. UYMMa02A]
MRSAVPVFQAAGTSAFGTALPAPRAVATTLSGALPCSTHATSGVIMSNWSAVGPPEQWFMPATGKNRAKLLASPPFAAARRSYQSVVSLDENIGSLVPW